MAAKTRKRPRARKPGTLPNKPASCLGEEAERLFMRVAEEAVHADRELFDNLSEHERKIVLQWLSEVIIEGDPKNIVHDTLWEIDYRRKPVSIETFINDDHYFGLICKDLDPHWVDDLKTVFSPGSDIFEWIMTGAIGTGKTTVAMSAMGYKLHCISCLRDPSSYYGLLPESLIIFGIYSITKRQVADTGYFKLRGWIDTSPYFHKEFPRSMKIDSKIDFKPAGQNLQVIPGSQELHALGLDLFSFCLSENHHVGTARGPVKITDMLSKPERVWTFDGREYYLTEPLYAEVTGYLPVIPIKLSNGQRLEPTAHHRWMVKDGAWYLWRRTDELRIGDLIVTSCKTGRSSAVEAEGNRGTTPAGRNRRARMGRSEALESRDVCGAAGSDTTYFVDVLARLHQAKGAGVQVAEVVEVSEALKARPVYDVVEVPRTHLFFTGVMPDKPMLIGHNSMDEVNFMREKRNNERGILAGQAYDLYNATHARIMSRFIRPGGTIPGIMLLMSSRNAQTSFLEERVKKVRSNPHTYVSDYALWEVKPKSKYKLPPFRIQAGDRVSQSRILADDEEPRKGCRIVDGIPGDFREAFEEDIDQALRDIAGVATFNISPLIRDRQSIFDAVRPTLLHPFTKPEVMIDYQDDVMLEEFFIVSTACRICESQWRPRLNPMSQRFMHIDLSLSGDCAGIAMGHVSGLIRKEKLKLDGTKSVSEYPFIIIDFMLRINPPPSSEIDLEKIRAFVYYIDKLYPLAMVTFDGFQSADCKQLLQKAGYDARLLSVDKTDQPYLSLRAAHFDRRIAMYNYEPYIREVLDLERDAKKEKVNHPTRSTKGGKGSKDVSDAVAGVAFACTNDARAFTGAILVDSIAEADETITRQIVDPDMGSSIGEQSNKTLRDIGGVRIDVAKMSMDD